MRCGNCCEMLVRRTAFPAALSGLYIREEMMQAEKEDTITPAAAPAPAPVVTVPDSAAPAAPAEAPPARHGRSRKTDAPASAPAGQEAPAVQQSPAAEQVPPDKYVCADTGEPIVDWVDPSDPNQTMYSRDWLYEYSVRTFKRPLCANRLLALRKEQEAAQKGPLPQEVIASQAANILSGGQQVNGQSQ